MLPIALWIAAIAPEAPDAQFRQPQLAVSNGVVAAAFGSVNAVYFVSSKDGAKTFGKPVRVNPDEGGEGWKLMLGRHRGPRIAMAGGAIVISAISSLDGNIRTWRSSDGGATWTRGARINDADRSAREGLHSMTGRGDLLYAVWLDLRDKGTRLYGSASRDGGLTWSKNVQVYESPDGHICECCHPSVIVSPKGEVVAMWRNWLNGSRDLYAATSADGGKTFRMAVKQGSGTWPLNACPMDGGGMAFDASGKLWSGWRRDQHVVLAAPDGAETQVAAGKDPAVAAGKHGIAMAWTEKGTVKAAWAGKAPVELDASGAFLHLAGDGANVYAAWESGNGIRIQQLQ